MKRIDLAATARRLHNAGVVSIFVHSHPDGDTLGSGFALAHALRALGKEARIFSEDPIPAMFDYMREGVAVLSPADLMPDPAFLVTVDVAAAHLLGDVLAARYGGRIDLGIDHHATNNLFAAETYLDPSAAATAEMVSDVIDALGVPMTKLMAACLYAGISTDTGCFRYSITTARSHRYAARYMDLGVETEPLDRAFFETHTKSYLALERMCLNNLRYFCGGRVAVVAATQAMFEQSGSDDEEYMKITARTRQIEGVIVGVSIRERPDGSYKISLRSHAPIDVAAIASRMGGGGHARAAGCNSDLPLEETIQAIVGYIEEALEAVSCVS